MNDGTAAKLGYYLRNAVHVTQGQCRSDGRRELQVRVTMTFDAPPPDAPNYVTGQTSPGEPYVVRTNVLAFAPVGGTVVAAQRDGAAAALATGEDHGRQVGTLTRRAGAGRDDRAGVHRPWPQHDRYPCGCGAHPGPHSRGQSVADDCGPFRGLFRRDQLTADRA